MVSLSYQYTSIITIDIANGLSLYIERNQCIALLYSMFIQFDK
jgi:hypothetical protein